MGDFLVFFTISTNTGRLQMLQFTCAFGKLFLFAVLCMLVIIESALHIIRCQPCIAAADHCVINRIANDQKSCRYTFQSYRRYGRHDNQIDPSVG